MKTIYSFLLIFFQIIFSFSQEKETQFRIDTNQYMIMKIDSIDNFYLINFQSNNACYKVVSRKILNSCSNLVLGEVYKLSLSEMFPFTLNFSDQRFHIGEGVYIDIDYGNNLYYAKELCGLCYEFDSIKLLKCKQLENSQYVFENTMQYIYFHYDIDKDKSASFFEFYRDLEKNSISFVLNNIKTIPIFISPEISDINYELFNDTIEHKIFQGKIFYEYKNLYFIKGRYAGDDNEIMGWIEKKHIIN